VPCALLFVFRKTKKKESNFVRFAKESNITGKKILVSTRTPDDITIKHLRCTRRVAKKLLFASSYLPVSLPVRMKLIFSQLTEFVIRYIELYYSYVEKI